LLDCQDEPPDWKPLSSVPSSAMTDEPRADYAQYLVSWLSILKSDKKAVFAAASKRQKAHRFSVAERPLFAQTRPSVLF
jgi:antirestriction protein ArdC